jgi:putative transposase
MKAVFDTLDGIVVERPPLRPYHLQHICLDKGYDFPEIERGVIDRRYVPHIRHRGEDPDDVVRCHQPKRWVVERSASWLNRFRKLLIRCEKAENYLALVQLTCCITVYRRTILG